MPSISASCAAAAAKSFAAARGAGYGIGPSPPKRNSCCWQSPSKRRQAGSRRRCYLLPKAIAKSVGITKTEVMRLVGEMRQSGLIEFSRPKRSGDEGLEFRLPDASERARNHRERAAA
jgi:hypothetical protein